MMYLFDACIKSPYHGGVRRIRGDRQTHSTLSPLLPPPQSSVLDSLEWTVLADGSFP